MMLVVIPSFLLVLNKNVECALYKFTSKREVENHLKEI